MTDNDADDVREALIDELRGTVGWLKRTNNLIDADRVMRAIAFMRDVRLRGTVTDAEVEAALAAMDRDPECYFGHTAAGVRAVLEAAREARS